MAGKSVISVADFTDAFSQIPLDEASKKYHQFEYDNKTYRFTVLPQGAANSLAVLGKYLEHILKDAKHKDNFSIYVDDLIVATNTVEEHYDTWREILSILEKNNVKIAIPKCKLPRSRVIFLGRLYTTEGVTLDPKTIKTLKDTQVPDDTKSLWSFTSTITHYLELVDTQGGVFRTLLDLLKEQKERIAKERGIKINLITKKHCGGKFNAKNIDLKKLAEAFRGTIQLLNRVMLLGFATPDTLPYGCV